MEIGVLAEQKPTYARATRAYCVLVEVVEVVLLTVELSLWCLCFVFVFVLLLVVVPLVDVSCVS